MQLYMGSGSSKTTSKITTDYQELRANFRTKFFIFNCEKVKRIIIYDFFKVKLIKSIETKTL